MTTARTSAETAESAKTIEVETSNPTPNTAPTEARTRHRRRTIKRVLSITSLTRASTTGSGCLWLNVTADVQATGNPDCTATIPTGGPAADRTEAHRALCTRLSGMTNAWDRMDADTYGAQFTKSATKGHRGITEGYRVLFNGFVKDTKLADSCLAIRFYGPATAIVTTRCDTCEGAPKKPGELSKTQTCTLIRDTDDTWRIAAFHSTKRQRVMERISFLFDADTKLAAEK